jgi:hypothetical protein
MATMMSIMLVPVSLHISYFMRPRLGFSTWVLVTRDVIRPSKRRRLMDNGAIVVEVNHVHHNINILTMCEPRWMDTFTKWQDANVWPETSTLRQGPICGC